MNLARASHRTLARGLATLLVVSLLVPPHPAASQGLDSVCVYHGTARTVVSVPSFGTLIERVAESERAPDPAGPEGWLVAFESAYESGDSAAYASLLAVDYRFLASDPEVARRFPDGMSREEELTSFGRLFGGVVEEGLPRADLVLVHIAMVSLLDDPSYPGNPDHAIAHARVELVIGFDDGTSMRDLASQAFWLVRDSGGSWVCRLWVERPDAAAIAAVAPSTGLAGDPDVVADAGDGGPTGVPYPNPAFAGRGIAYGYVVGAGGEEVAFELYDVAGGRVAEVERGQRPPGRHVAHWNGRNDAGARVAPGVYFLRARIGERIERSRVVIAD